MRLLFVILISSCAAPVYDDRIGVEGVPIPSGALAGRFALVGQAADHADVPLLGPQTGGGMTIYLVDIGDGYDASATACRVINFDVAGLSTSVSDDTVAAIPRIGFLIEVDHATGAIAAEGFREVWAWTPASVDDALPAGANDARVIDMEGDGKPGATVLASGLVDGELYIVQRKTMSFDGVVRGLDEALGLIAHKKESTVLDATDDLLKTDTQREQHPDPKESWWHLTRVPSDATCDTLRAGLDDQTISLLRPF